MKLVFFLLWFLNSIFVFITAIHFTVDTRTTWRLEMFVSRNGNLNFCYTSGDVKASSLRNTACQAAFLRSRSILACRVPISRSKLQGENKKQSPSRKIYEKWKLKHSWKIGERKKKRRRENSRLVENKVYLIIGILLIYHFVFVSEIPKARYLPGDFSQIT